MTSWPDNRLWDDTDPADRWDTDDQAADDAYNHQLDNQLGVL